MFSVPSNTGEAMEPVVVINRRYTVVSPHNKASLDQLGPDTTRVHIAQFPYLWFIQAILDRAPRLEMLRVAPGYRRHLREESHLKLCRERRVVVVIGCEHLSTWRPNENRSSHWQTQRHFLLNLSPEQQAALDELLELEVDSALIAVRYFCLDGEEYVTQSALAQEYGYSPRDSHSISDHINGLLSYLDPSLTTGASAQRRANALRRLIPSLRQKRLGKV